MILVTGGAGYIGSHTCLQLLQQGHEVMVFDNLCNSSPVALQRVQTLAGRAVSFCKGDIRDPQALAALFAAHRFEAVVHFAGLKAVGESVAQPLQYYHNNFQGTLALLQAMQQANVKTLVFSSSATVYGDPQALPIAEDAPRSATNPYGQSKLMIEHMLADLCHADPAWRVARLRYFNPVGAHPSGQIGEDPSGTPNNLMPFVSQVACGVRPKLSVFGADYPTPDGTGVRDYIHVMDLARGHMAALERLAAEPAGALLSVNLGTGKGVSVLQLVAAFERASGKPVPYQIVARRPGDIASCYADASRAKTLLGWQAELDLDAMCADTWRWQAANPRGYGNS
jgi:UDP-glucose 4-epimerase